jgi:hypothetical protein
MKKTINSDGQQFHQYQQSERSPFTWIRWTHKIDHDTWRWRSRSWLGRDTTMWRVVSEILKFYFSIFDNK